MLDAARNLLVATEGCREDMHEPDEQGISARVIGNVLNNSCGTYLGGDPVMQELLVILLKNEHGVYFNLADLIALARIGARELLKQA